jgi:hypothetical protein
MNSDELLTAFRSDLPLADEATAQRIYARATSTRQRPPRRGFALAVAVAAICASVLAVVVTAGKPGRSNEIRGGGGGASPIRYQSEQFTGSGHSVTSIAMQIYSQIANATLQVQVFRSDGPQPPSSDNAGSQLVFQEQVPMTNLASAEPDGTLSTWSGRLTPSDWNGGCQASFYRIHTIVYPAGSSTEWGDGYTAWFQCSGPKLDPNHPFPN